jgi:hypothetical protein
MFAPGLVTDGLGASATINVIRFPAPAGPISAELVSDSAGDILPQLPRRGRAGIVNEPKKLGTAAFDCHE